MAMPEGDADDELVEFWTLLNEDRDVPVCKREATALATAQCSASRVTVSQMSSLTIRTDPEVERALEALTRDGLSRSEAARTAILEAERANRRARIRAEAESLRNDPEDVAASRELAAQMDAIRAW